MYVGHPVLQSRPRRGAGSGHAATLETVPLCAPRAKDLQPQIMPGLVKGVEPETSPQALFRFYITNCVELRPLVSDEGNVSLSLQPISVLSGLRPDELPPFTDFIFPYAACIVYILPLIILSFYLVKLRRDFAQLPSHRGTNGLKCLDKANPWRW